MKERALAQARPRVLPSRLSASGSVLGTRNRLEPRYCLLDLWSIDVGRLPPRYPGLSVSFRLWAHYGDKHSGICLGFEVEDQLVSPINYTDEKIDVEPIIRPAGPALRRRPRLTSNVRPTGNTSSARRRAGTKHHEACANRFPIHCRRAELGAGMSQENRQLTRRPGYRGGSRPTSIGERSSK